MADQDLDEIEIRWELMTPMESALWSTVLALHMTDADGGLGAADEALAKLRRLYEARPHRPNPEDEAAASNVYLTYDEFAPWYAVAHRIQCYREPGYRPPTSDQIDEAYERYSLSRGSFY
jgi:hypothetical protein